MRMRALPALFLLVLVSCPDPADDPIVDGGLSAAECVTDRDCGDSICNQKTGRCRVHECASDTDCEQGFVCDSTQCPSACVLAGSEGETCLLVDDAAMCLALGTRTCATGFSCQIQSNELGERGYCLTAPEL